MLCAGKAPFGAVCFTGLVGNFGSKWEHGATKPKNGQNGVLLGSGCHHVVHWEGPIWGSNCAGIGGKCGIKNEKMRQNRPKTVIICPTTTKTNTNKREKEGIFISEVVRQL